MFTILIVWTHYRGGYQFWDSLNLAVGGSVLAAVFSYWRARRGKAGEGDVLLKRHPLLIQSLRTGIVVACAAFTLLIGLAHFRGAYEFWEIFYLAAAAGVAGSIEGYRRALHKLAGEGEPT